MALSTIAGFNVGGTEPIDKRLVLTKAEMLAFDDSLMPSDYFCMCSDDHKQYQYNKNNTVDPVTGKFRVFESGSGGSTIQVDTLPTASATELGKIYQFIGTSTENYLNGSFYKCVTDGTDYSWVSVDTFPSWRGTSSELEEALEDLPTGTRIEVTDDYEEDDVYTKTETDELLDEKQDVLPTVVNDKYLHSNSTTGALEWSDLTNTFRNVTTFSEIASSFTLQTNRVYLLIGNCHPEPNDSSLDGIGLIVTFYDRIMRKINLSGTMMDTFTVSGLILSKGATGNFRGILYDISGI